MKLNEKNYILKLRDNGCSYTQIAEQTGFSENTVKSICRRRSSLKLDNSRPKINTHCKNCGEELVQSRGHRQKTFCSDKCRLAWWHSKDTKLEPNSPYRSECKNCGKEYNCRGKKAQKYCSYGCYIIDRFSHDRAGQVASEISEKL